MTATRLEDHVPVSARAAVQRYSKSQLAAAFRDLYREQHGDVSEDEWLRDLEGRLLLAPPTPEQFR